MEVNDCKGRIYGLHSTFGTFTGTPAIDLLSFLATLIDALNVTGAPEATVMRVIAYYLDGEALYVPEEQLRKISDDPEKEQYGEITLCAWPHVLEALLKIFLTDDVFQGAYNAVTRAKQHEG